jgi:hypothetical protein
MMMTICGLTLDCEFEHEPAEPAAFDDPGWPAIYTLTSAKLGGVDIAPVMSLLVIQELERRAAWP